LSSDNEQRGAQLLHPPLPYEMHARAERAAQDVRLQQFVEGTTRRRVDLRRGACGDAFGDAYDDVRALAGRIRQHCLDHLDVHLERFMATATAAGIQVHVASDAAEACAICRDIARADGGDLVVKSKSMVTEEIRLVPALEAAGIRAVETDLGEFIVQLDDDAPSHIVTPMIHKDRADAGRAVSAELGTPYSDDPARITKLVRAHLRTLYQKANIGISGANFLVADTGSIVICTNEGNADLAVTLPRVHVAITGIEKVIADLRRSSTGRGPPAIGTDRRRCTSSSWTTAARRCWRPSRATCCAASGAGRASMPAPSSARWAAVTRTARCIRGRSAHSSRRCSRACTTTPTCPTPVRSAAAVAMPVPSRSTSRATSSDFAPR
jgi:hypothetical protein